MIKKQTDRGAVLRPFELQDSDSVLDIWLKVNIEAHGFIDRGFWEQNKNEFLNECVYGSKTYLIEAEKRIRGFACVDANGFISALFIESEYHNMGLGSMLINLLKREYKSLSLNVYVLNRGAFNFYLKHGFKVRKLMYTNSFEYFMEL